MVQFFAWFLLFSGVYYAPFGFADTRDYLTRGILRGYASASAAILNLCGANVVVIDRTISGAATLQIAKSCDAIQAKIILVSAILAFPARWRTKVVGSLICLAALVFLNILRIGSLYFLARDWPTWFDWMHLKVWQPTLVVAAVALFVCWTRYALRNPIHASSTPSN